MGHLLVRHFSPLRNSFSPSRLHRRHLGPVYLAKPHSYYRLEPNIINSNSMRSDSNTPPFRWTTAIMWDRGYIRNASNLKPCAIERPYCRLTSRPRAFDAHIQIFHSKFSSDISNPACGNLGRKWCTFPRTFESPIAGSRPSKGITLPICYVDNRIVKRCINMRDTVVYIPFYLLSWTRRTFCHNNYFSPYRV
uniref:Uncharacterized protein n=1 Tax=Candidatus Kentrum eta TaxID=2126337 RepID=A0A450VCT7_9GAMM|nr:MAG: hypothetical protein BECKH772A_GA0070896_102643 [Candidatus Kentron sp. H]VFK02577.1 MAG: hypothetical protein BECKH772B_GA0070898_102893 [Candidatus Kentron sp. H]VFK05308.1 MAG: hypothetical protein BECKH772C_GA0070978_102583 [Candidatus Kentron sp. H]